jgi:structural maintenance of chromosome 4
VNRLYDLIKPKNEKYKYLFYYSLRDPLVCDNIESATKIAYGRTRWRVVTLKGELIETSGTMSGGGKNIHKGGMSSKETKEIPKKEYEKLQTEIKEIESELNDIRERKNNMTSQLRQLEEENEKLNDEINKSKLDEKDFVLKIQDLKNKKEELKKELKNNKIDENEMKELKEKLNKYQKEKKKVEEESEEIEGQIKDLNEKIENCGGEKLKIYKEKAKVLTKEIEDINKILTKNQVEKEDLEVSIPKLEIQIEKNDLEIEEMNKKVKEIEKEKKEIEEKAKEVFLSFENLKEISEELEIELTNSTKKYESQRNMISKLSEKEVDFKNKSEDIEKELSDIKKRLRIVFERIKESLNDYILINDMILNNKDEDEEILNENNNNNNIEKNNLENKDKMEIEEEEENEKINEEENEEEEKETKENELLKKHFKNMTKEFIKNIDEDKIKYEITILESEIDKLKPNLNSIKDYNEKNKIYKKKMFELEEITKEYQNTQKEYDDLRKKRLTEFMEGFQTITLKLKEIYQMITLGGDAELELLDSLDPFSEGIIFSVRPPNKSWKNISNLSGGEKTLSSLSLVFALHHFKPTPIYVMDEIDAALDFRNVSIIANYIKERTKNCAQFIVISLRNNMFELGDLLVGIYKTNNITKSITLNPKVCQEQLLKLKTKN